MHCNGWLIVKSVKLRELVKLLLIFVPALFLNACVGGLQLMRLILPIFTAEIF